MFEDRNLKCNECGADFTLTSAEQEFFLGKGSENLPNTCPSCRRAPHDSVKAPTDNKVAAQQMFEVSCSLCDDLIQLPYEPDGRKQIYCEACSQQKKKSPSWFGL